MPGGSGPAAAGEAGVRHAMDILATEPRHTMALRATARVDEIDRDLVRPARS